MQNVPDNSGAAMTILLILGYFAGVMGVLLIAFGLWCIIAAWKDDWRYDPPPPLEKK